MKHPAANPLRREFAKPAFDEIQPRRAGRRKVQDKAGMRRQPRGDVRMRMRAVVIHDEVQRQGPRELAVESPQEFQEFLVRMVRETLPDDAPFRDVQRGKQRRRPVPLVVMGHGAAAALFERQPRLRAIERLNLALLVDAQDDRFVRRVEIEAHDIGELLDEPFVPRQFERPGPMRLQPMRIPNALHRCVTHALGLRHRPRTPVGGGLRRCLGGRGHHAVDLCGRDGPWAAAARRHGHQGLRAAQGESVAPQQDRRTTNAQLFGDRVVRDSVRGQEDDLAPHGDALRGAVGARPGLQEATILGTNHKLFGPCPHGRQHSTGTIYCQVI